MADFVAVLRKTLDGLGETTPEVRAKVYDKARSTIAAKLAAINPPPPAAVAERQKRALEDAIAAVESGYAKPAPPASDPLAELENIFSSIDRNRTQPTYVRPAPTRPPQWVSPQLEPSSRGNRALTPPSNQAANTRQSSSKSHPPPVIDKKVAEVIGELDDQEKGSGPPSRRRKGTPKPPEPATPAGPHYQIRAGKLAGSLSPPGNAEVELQRSLHNNIKKATRDAIAIIPGIKNRFPELARTIESYASIVDCDTEDINVVNLWAVGSALYSFESAYRNQNIIKTLSEPLEPQVESSLHNISRLHGAFVMGFEEGRDLVQRSDAFVHEEELLDEIREPGDKLITIFAENSELVESRTRDITKPIADYVHEFGWSGTRTGYAAYTVVCNGILAVVRGLVGKPNSVLDVGVKATTIAGLAGHPEFVQVALPIFIRNSSQILAFFAHSPEFFNYIRWALALMDEDKKYAEKEATPRIT